MVNTENDRMNVKKQQSCADLALSVQRGIEFERQSLQELEQRYVEEADEDERLVFAWACGYESRKREEIEGVLNL
jgi:hypothetical protein